MAVLNYSGEEINAKIVYYGPGLSGKTTNLDRIHKKMPVKAKGKMVSMKTRTDRTLFFDFLPLELGDIGGYTSRFLLYTVPGQVCYNATRKLVLKGVDAVVFVADSSREKRHENIESLRNLEDNLNEHGLSLDNIPWVIQYNKRDAADAMTVQELDEQLNLLNVPAFEATAIAGEGVYETFAGIAGLVHKDLQEKLTRGEVNAADGSESGDVTREGADGYEEAIDNALREIGDADPPPAAQKAPPAAKSAATTPPAPPPADAPGNDEGVYDITSSDKTSYEAIVASVETSGDSADVSEKPGGQTDGAPDPSPDARPVPTAPVTPPRPEEKTTKSIFATMASEEIDDDVGRTLEFDDMAASPEVRNDAPNEFITDPMGSRTSADLGAEPGLESGPGLEPRPGLEPGPELESRPALEPGPEPEPRPGLEPQPKLEPAPEATTEAFDEIEVRVPVVLRRSQVRKTMPVKLLLEIEVVDD